MTVPMLLLLLLLRRLGKQRDQHHHTGTARWLVLFYLCGSVAAWTFSKRAPLRYRPHHALSSSSTAVNGEDIASSVRLLSLQWSDTSPHINRVWKWKDAVLGDGRDFFVPKPRTLTALNTFMVNNVEAVQECCVISNCARFELLLVVNSTTDDDEETSSLEERISQCILAQVESHARNNNIMNSILNLDRPESIDVHATTTTNNMILPWTHVSGVESTCRHLSQVAAGMATRPNRPNRPVPFRPFSSRDAHILLQLKRISEIARRYPVAKSILDAALTAGKAARDPNQVPELESLRRYGTGNSRYSTEAPAQISKAAADAAAKLAIEPTVDQCVASFKARQQSDAITRLRHKCQEMAENADELKWIKQQLHEPTMKLRKGLNVNEQHVLETVESELNTLRRRERVVVEGST